MPDTEEEFREALGIPGDEDLPDDVAEYYERKREGKLPVGNIFGDVFGEDEYDLKHKCYIRLPAGYELDTLIKILLYASGPADGPLKEWLAKKMTKQSWYEMYPMTEEQYDTYHTWFEGLDPDEQWSYISGAVRGTLTEEQIRTLLGFMTPPRKLLFWESAKLYWITPGWYFEDYTLIGNTNTLTADLKSMFGRASDIERDVGRARIASGVYYHTWTDQNIHSDPVPMQQYTSNPYLAPSPEAAAYDMGWGDGERFGHKLGINNLARIVHEPTAFDDLQFPDATYAQIYNNAFCTAIQSGYDRGQHDWELSFLDRDMYYKECKKWCDLLSSMGTIIAFIGLMLK